MGTLEHLNTATEQALEQRDYQKAQQLAWQQLDIDKLHEPAVHHPAKQPADTPAINPKPIVSNMHTAP